MADRQKEPQSKIQSPPPRIHITPSFCLGEFDSHDGLLYPQEWVNARLRPLCNVLEAIRDACGGHPVRILSGYRSPSWNEKVGGAVASQHVRGTAADITVKGVDPAAVHATIERLIAEGRIRVGGLGRYATFTHVDIRERPPGVGPARWEG